MSDGEQGGGDQGGAADIMGGADQGGGDGGAAAAAAAAAAAGDSGGDQGGGGADPEFYGQIPAEVGEGETASLRDFLKANDVKDLTQLTKIARDNMKALRESGRIKVPAEGAPAEEVAAYHKAIGVPDKPEDYKLPTVKDAAGNELEVNSDRLAMIASAAHKRGIPAAALEGVLQDLADADAQELATAESGLSTAAAAHAAKWGGEKDNNLAAVDNGIKLLGLKRDETLKLRAALGPERALDLLKDLGAKVREDVMVTGERKAFLGDPTAAQAEMDAMKKDPATVDKIYISGTPEEARWKRLSGIVEAGVARQQAAAQGN